MKGDLKKKKNIDQNTIHLQAHLLNSVLRAL